MPRLLEGCIFTFTRFLHFDPVSDTHFTPVFIGRNALLHIFTNLWGLQGVLIGWGIAGHRRTGQGFQGHWKGQGTHLTTFLQPTEQAFTSWACISTTTAGHKFSLYPRPLAFCAWFTFILQPPICSVSHW